MTLNCRSKVRPPHVKCAGSVSDIPGNSPNDQRRALTDDDVLADASRLRTAGAGR